MLSAIVVLAAALASEPRPVPKQGRELVIVSDLVSHVGKYKWLYRFMEVSGVSLAYARLGDQYAHIRVSAGSHATYESFHTGLGALAAEPHVQTIDVFFHLHGWPNTLFFFDGGHDTKDLARDLLGHVDLAPKLRLAYSTACYGSTHNPDLIRAGFQTASGALKVNANAMYDYPAVLTAWRDGATFQLAQDLGNYEGAQLFFDRWAKAHGFGDADSHKIVAGAPDLTIGTSTR